MDSGGGNLTVAMHDAGGDPDKQPTVATHAVFPAVAADDVTECILLYGAFCNGNRGKAREIC